MEKTSLHAALETSIFRRRSDALLIYGKNEQGALGAAQNGDRVGSRDKARCGIMNESEDTEFGRELIAAMQEALAIVR